MDNRFNEKATEWSAKQGKEIPVWQTPKYIESRNKAVEMMLADGVQDDAAQADVGEPISELLNEQPAAEQQQQEATPQKEPGWIKQRIGKAVEKAVAEAEARVTAQYEAMLAPIRESVLDRQAEDLVKSGEFKSLETAKEYVRLKGGVVSAPAAEPEQQKPTVQQRDEQGRFVSNNDAMTHARADLLAKQAQKIKERRGLDVMQAINADEYMKHRVLSGEWDFYDVAESMASPQHNAPVPVRTSNGGTSPSAVSISGMTDEQFRRLQANLANGRIYDMRK